MPLAVKVLMFLQFQLKEWERIKALNLRLKLISHKYSMLKTELTLFNCPA